jgi:hypothetical protein
MDKDNKRTEVENIDKKLHISDVSKRYSSVIADIYAEHHINPFTDIQKHNEGIIKAMVDFAIFYKEHSSL